MNTHNVRFAGAHWYKQVKGTKVTIVGAGGIGSWAALSLARTGFDVTVFDDDVVEEHNIGGQLFSHQHIGLSKVEALNRVIKYFCGTSITAVVGKVSSCPGNDTAIVILAVDNLDTRRKVVESAPGSLPIIDGRMTAESFIIYTMTSAKPKIHYLRNLPEETAVDNGPCSFRATSFNASIIGGMITNAAIGICDPYRRLPYMQRFDLPMLRYSVYDDYTDLEA